MPVTGDTRAISQQMDLALEGKRNKDERLQKLVAGMRVVRAARFWLQGDMEQGRSARRVWTVGAPTLSGSAVA